MIRLEKIGKSYTTGKLKVPVLNQLDFKVTEGDFTIIRGPSGSGKSTLLNLLGLLDEPTEGNVFLDGRLVSFLDFDQLAEERSRSISFIFQSFHLNPVLTAEENVMIPLLIRKDIPLDERVHRVTHWVDQVGLRDHRHQRPDELSGGQRQRVAIARALVSGPRLVIADEPTANLDSKTSHTILQLMSQLNRDKGIAFVFATHDPTLDAYARTELLMKDGHLEQVR